MTGYVPPSWDACGDGDDEVVTCEEWSEPYYEEDWRGIDAAIDARDDPGSRDRIRQDRVRRLVALANRWAAPR